MTTKTRSATPAKADCVRAVEGGVGGSGFALVRFLLMMRVLLERRRMRLAGLRLRGH
jgi:hypothetical protein